MTDPSDLPVSIAIQMILPVGNGDGTTVFEERVAVKKTHGLSETEAIKSIFREEGYYQWLIQTRRSTLPT